MRGRYRERVVRRSATLLCDGHSRNPHGADTGDRQTSDEKRGALSHRSSSTHPIAFAAGRSIFSWLNRLAVNAVQRKYYREQNQHRARGPLRVAFIALTDFGPEGQPDRSEYAGGDG